MDLWSLHKGKAGIQKKVCQLIQRMLVDKKDIIGQYHHDILSKPAVVKFLKENRELIVTVGGRQLLKDFIPNYRSRYGHHVPGFVFAQFEKVILPKKEYHSSDLAIACNLLRYIQLTPDQQTVVLSFIGKRMGPNKLLGAASRLSVQKTIAIEIVKLTGKYTQ